LNDARQERGLFLGWRGFTVALKLHYLSGCRWWQVLGISVTAARLFPLIEPWITRFLS
jgi:hypothetical protein